MRNTVIAVFASVMLVVGMLGLSTPSESAAFWDEANDGPMCIAPASAPAATVTSAQSSLHTNESDSNRVEDASDRDGEPAWEDGACIMRCNNGYRSCESRCRASGYGERLIECIGECGRRAESCRNRCQ